jgi:ABC-2 type transport system permease protein
MSRYLNKVASPGYNFFPALLGAVLLWDFFIRVMQGVTMAFFEDVWSRNFLNIFATPLSISEYIGGLVLSSMATSSVGLVVMLVLSTTVFGLSFFAYGVLLLPFLLVLFLFGIALGILGISVVLRCGVVRVADPGVSLALCRRVLSLIDFAGLDAGGLLFAAAIVVFESIRTILAGGAVPRGPLVWAMALAGIDILVACCVFTWTYRYAVRTGLIARYSAESV